MHTAFAFVSMLLAQETEAKLKTHAERPETTVITVSGDVDLDWVWRDRALSAARGTFGTYGAGPGDAGRSEAVIHAGYHVRLIADLSSKVRIVLSVENPRLDGTAFPNADVLGTNPEGLTPLVREAAFVFHELFDPALALTVGANKWSWNVRDDGKALFWDPAHSGSITSNVLGAMSGGNGASTPGVDELQPTGLLLAFNREQIHVTVALLPAIIERGAAAKDEAGYLGALTYDLEGVGKGSRLGMILAVTSTGFTRVIGSSATESTLITLGGGVALRDVGMEGLELFGEFYVQGGTIGTTTSAGGTVEIDAGGFAIEAGAKYRLGGSLLPWVELKFTLLSGDDDQSLTDTDCDAWLSYGNHADLMIIEDPFYGFGWNANEFAVKLSGGVALSMMGKTNNLRLRGIFGWCDATEDVTFASGREDRLGMEFDAMAEWEFHKQVTINGGFGLLMASQILEESLGGSSNANASSSSFLFTLGLAARF